jgi:hypothetical protein
LYAVIDAVDACRGFQFAPAEDHGDQLDENTPTFLSEP